MLAGVKTNWGLPILPHPKIAHCPGVIPTPSNTWLHGPTQAYASRSIQPFLQGTPKLWTERHADHATKSVAIGRIYAMHTMWPNEWFSHLLSNSACIPFKALTLAHWFSACNNYSFEERGYWVTWIFRGEMPYLSHNSVKAMQQLSLYWLH